MRDPNRIPVVLDAIIELWSRHPDMRLMQLLLNPFPGLRPQDLYNLEENDLISGLDRIYGLPEIVHKDQISCDNDEDGSE